MPRLHDPRSVPWSRIRRWPGLAARLVGRELPLWLVVVLLHIALAVAMVLSLMPYASVIGPAVFAALSLPATGWLYFGLARKADTGRFPGLTPAVVAMTLVFAVVVAMCGSLLGAFAWASPDLRQVLTDTRTWDYYLDPVSMLAVMIPWLAIMVSSLTIRPFALVAVCLTGLPMWKALLFAEVAYRRNPAAMLALRGVYLAVSVLFVFPLLDWILALSLPFVVSLTYVAYRDICEHSAENQPRHAEAGQIAVSLR